MRFENVQCALMCLATASLAIESTYGDEIAAQRSLFTLPPPRNLRVEVLDETKVVLEWDAPFRSTRDLRIDGYAVAYNCTEESAAVDKPRLVSWRFVEAETERTYTIGNLRPATEYEIFLSAYGTYNGVLVLSSTVSVRIYTGPLFATLGYAFPVATMLVIMVLATVVYARIQQDRRRHFTIQ